MKTLLILFVLLFSSSVLAELPTSLFGVEIFENLKKYKKLEVNKLPETKRLCNDNSIVRDEKGVLLGKLDVQKINIKNNDLFDLQCIEFDDEGFISGVSGRTSWSFYNNFNKSDLNRFGLEESMKLIQNIRKNLSTLYEIDERKFTVINAYDGNGPQLISYFYIKYKMGKKGIFVLHGGFHHMKSKDPSPNSGTIGYGSIHLKLQTNKNDIDNYFDFIQDYLKDIEIKEKDLDNYVELFQSSVSGF